MFLLSRTYRGSTEFIHIGAKMYCMGRLIQITAQNRSQVELGERESQWRAEQAQRKREEKERQRAEAVETRR